MGRYGGTIVGLCALGALLVGCAGGADPGGGQEPTPPEDDATQTPEVTSAPEATPDPEAIRDVDFGELTWTWDTAGKRFEVDMVGGEATATDPGVQAEVRISAGEPVYADANGDGLLDAAVPAQWVSVGGNGIAEEVFIWLAQADAPEEPEQLADPIAVGARCGDTVDAVTAIDGGFRIQERMLATLEQNSACAEAGSLARTRDVGAVGDGTGAGSYPATLDGKGWGGYCPVREYTEGVIAEAQGQVAPSVDVPATSETGERMYSPMQRYPLYVPEGWRLVGFLPEPDVEGDDSLICVWMPDEEGTGA